METKNINDNANLSENEIKDDNLNVMSETEPIFHAQIEEEVETEEQSQETEDISDVIMKYPVIDYSSLSKAELIEKFKQLLSQLDVVQIRIEVEPIKTFFYKKLKQENEERRKKIVDDGGSLDEFQPETDALEVEFKELYNAYREKRQELIVDIESQKQANYKRKLDIIEKINELTTKPESLKITMDEFHELNRLWKEVGIVPQNNVKEIYNNYNLARDNFYNWLNLNKEARDYDLKHNLDAKIDLCEKAEQLILETNVVKALGQLQVLHERWRELGPVYPDKKEEIWERFKDATHKIHKNHQEFFQKRREEEENNLKAKTILCEIAEEIANKIYNRYKDWEEATKNILDLQQRWKTIGMVPRIENAAIYKRFRIALDQFFSTKKNFYEQKSDEENKNLQLKTDLCIRAESLKDSNDWKKTTYELISLQKEWKKIGPVPRKDSEPLWQRFRAVCNEFFERKANHFSSLESLLDENLSKKENLISELDSFEYSDNPEDDLMRIRKLQKDWFDIGPVVEQHQDDIQRRYKQATQKLFSNLKIDEKKKILLNFKIKVESMLALPNPDEKLKAERMNVTKQLHNLENDLKTLENNIGFFSKSKNADNLIKDFVSKIDEGHKQTDVLKEQIKYIDNLIKQVKN
jgi:hypothetical protein